MTVPGEVHDAILDAHADCLERLAKVIAKRSPLTPEEIHELDGYSALVGRENVPPEIDAAISRGAAQ